MAETPLFSDVALPMSSAAAPAFTERRSQWRYNVLLPGKLIYQDWTGDIIVSNISSGGLLLKTLADPPAWEIETRCSVDIPQFGKSRFGKIVMGTEKTARMVFDPASMPDMRLIAKAAHVGTVYLIEKAISDHEAFVATVLSAIAGHVYLKASDLPNTHRCGLGQWYDMVKHGHIRSCPSFPAIAEPHILIHNYGKQALLFLQNGNIEQAKIAADKMKQTSQIIISLLSKLRMEVSINFESSIEHPSLYDPSLGGRS